MCGHEGRAGGLGLDLCVSSAGGLGRAGGAPLQAEVIGLSVASALTGAAAGDAGVDDGLAPLLGAGHGEGALVHSVLTAAEARQPRTAHRTLRLQRRAAV